MKYIVFKFLGCELPVVFDGTVFNHDNIKVVSDKYGNGVPISAGHVHIFSKEEVYVKGDSFSLNLKSRKEDAEIIKRMLER
jgi:hypothetical protein